MLSRRSLARSSLCPTQGDSVAQELYKALTQLQTEQAPDTNGWLVPVEEGLHRTMH